MKRLIFILVFLAVFLTTAIFAYRHPITITINSQQFIVEFPLLVGVIAFLSIHFLLLFLNRLFSLPKHWQQILLQYRRKKAVYYLNLAAQQLVLNEPFTKLKSLVAYAPYSPLPIWHYWLAAQGALNQHDFKNCQLYLQKARFLSNIDSTLLDLSTATLLLKQELPSEAINYLIRCLKQHPAAIKFLTILLETY